MEKNTMDVLSLKTIAILIYLLKSKEYIISHQIYKDLDITYSHVTKVLENLEMVNLIEKEKTGRMKIITLTHKGKNVAEHLSEIEKILEG